jgi:hypothetical protein
MVVIQDKYLELNRFFREKAEEEGVPISPTIGRVDIVRVMPSIYFEIYFDRVFSIQWDEGPLQSPFKADFWFSTFSHLSRDLLFLTVDTSGVPINLGRLWEARKGWMHRHLDEAEMSRLLNSFVTR